MKTGNHELEQKDLLLALLGLVFSGSVLFIRRSAFCSRCSFFTTVAARVVSSYLVHSIALMPLGVTKIDSHEPHD